MRLDLTLLAALATASAVHAAAPATLLWDPARLQKAKDHYVAKSDPKTVAAVNQNIQLANSFVASGETSSVINQKLVPPTGDKHDYSSLYWYTWPCNKNPCGISEPSCSAEGLPWVFCDGHHNPDTVSNTAKVHLYRMIAGVDALALAYYYTGNEQYAQQAANMLKVFFVDPATRMNPNFQHSQATLGVNDGLSSGIIDAYKFSELLDAIILLRGSASYPAAVDSGVKSWFQEFGTWLQKSGRSRNERNSFNNHAMYWSQTALSIALFNGNTAFAKELANELVQTRIPAQINDQGIFIEEVKRPTPYHYESYTLTAVLRAALLSKHVGVDVFSNPRVKAACYWLLPRTANKQIPFGYPDKQGAKYEWRDYGEWLRIAAWSYKDAAFEQMFNAINAGGTYNGGYGVPVSLVYPPYA